MKYLDQILKKDSIEFMKKLGDKSVDLILTDPPYNAKNIGPNSRVYKEGIMQLPLPEYKKFCRDWFREARRVAKTLVFTPGIANLCFYPQPSWVVCWHKPAAVSFNRFGGFNAWEPIFVYGKIAKGKRLPQDYILINTHNLANGPEKAHPCPKPMELMHYLVDKFSNEGDIVYDPFTGSGTTLLAAKLQKRKYIGTEIVKVYVDLAQSRVDNVTGNLF